MTFFLPEEVKVSCSRRIKTRLPEKTGCIDTAGLILLLAGNVGKQGIKIDLADFSEFKVHVFFC